MPIADKPTRHVGQLPRLLALLALLLPVVTANDAHHNTLDITLASPAAVSNSTSAAWSLLSSPSSFLPTARYGHSSVALPSSIVVTHGYQYDHSASSPLWLSDTWSFSLTGHHWRQALPPCTDRQVVAAVCPCARMGAVLMVAGERAYLYGGDDGGASRGQNSYTYNLFSDLWSVPLAALAADAADESSAVRWQHETTAVDNASLTALGYQLSLYAAAAGVAHAQHTAYVRRVSSGTSELLVFGGMVPRANDSESDSTSDTTGDPGIVATNTLWRLPLSDSSTRQWQLMSCAGPRPAPRYGHSMAGSGVTSSEGYDDVFMYGGFIRGQPNFDDLWLLSLPRNQPSHCRWLLLSPTQPQSSGVQPASRGYATMLASQRFVLLFGGSHCAPGCDCSHELWAFDHALNVWSTPQLVSSEQPQGRYKHTAVAAWPGDTQQASSGCLTVYVFGGESYSPQKYHSDVWRLRYSHIGSGHACESVWEMWMGERPVWEVTAWSIVLLLMVSVALFVRRRVLREIKTN